MIPEPGKIYKVRIKSVKEKRRKKSDPRQMVITYVFMDESNPLIPKGHKKFYVYSRKDTAFTIITAENIHHAGNKAAKLYGEKFTGISREEMSKQFWKYYSIKDFGQLLRGKQE